MAAICRSQSDHEESRFISASSFIASAVRLISLFQEPTDFPFSNCHFHSFSINHTKQRIPSQMTNEKGQMMNGKCSTSSLRTNQVLINRAQVVVDRRHRLDLNLAHRHDLVEPQIKPIRIASLYEQASGDRHAHALPPPHRFGTCAPPATPVDRNESESASGARHPFRRAAPKSLAASIFSPLSL